MGLLGLFALLFAATGMRVRRSGLVLVSILTLSMVACKNGGPLADDGPAGDGTGATGDTGGGPEPLTINPNLSHVTAGLIFPGAKYEEIAVGNVVRSISSSACCQDYVIGGENEADARLLYGGGSTTNGLTFLDETADLLVQMADANEGIDDLALADFDDDGNNDLVALLTNAELGVRLGNGAPMTPFGSLAQYSAASGMVAGGGKLAVGDMDCDADLDVTVTAPDDDAVVILYNDGDGVFDTLEGRGSSSEQPR